MMEEITNPRTRKAKCDQCDKCQPCPRGLDIGELNKCLNLVLDGSQEKFSAVFGAYKQLELHASDCAACGSCEPRCPIAVPIIGNMVLTKRIFGM